MRALTSHKGQVTLFIIIGLLVTALAALFFFYRSTIIEGQAREAQQILEDVPLEFNPVKVFTEDCLKVVGEEALRMLGQGGGYIYPREWHQMKFNPSNVTEGDGVMLGSEVFVPYWYRNTRANDADMLEIALRMPDMHEMEGDIKRRIEEELDSCTDGYRAFADSFNVEEGDREATVSFFPGVVRIALEYPLTISSGSAQNEMRHFYTEVQLDVVKLHTVATQLTRLQQNYTFLETQALNLMNIFSDVDNDMLMPMTASRFGFEKRVVWDEMTVKEDLKLILSNYVPLLRVLGAGNEYGYTYPQTEKYVDVKQRIYNDMIIQLPDQAGAAGVEVRFNYLDMWEPYFSMGCEDGVCKSQSATTPLSFPPMGYFGMQRYKGVYDISYPVLVSLRSPQPDGNDYEFLFALEGNIRNNRGAKTGAIPSSGAIFRQTLLCDRHQRVSGTIAVLVRDAHTRQPVPGAQVSYVLGDSSCEIDVTGVDGTVEQQFPDAIGGAVHAFADGYLGSAQPLDTIAGKNDSVVIELWPYHDINISVQKKKLVKCGAGSCASDGRNIFIPGLSLSEGWTLVDTALPLENYEQAAVFFERISGIDDSAASAVVVAGTEPQEMSLPAGTYKLRIDLVSDEEFLVPASGPMPQLRIDPLPNGGLLMDNTTLLVLDSAQYYPARAMTLYAVSYGLTDIPVEQRTLDDATVAGSYEDPSRAYAHLLQPTYE